MEHLIWIGPLLAFAGALIGGVLPPWVTGAVAEKRADKALVREARIAVERWYSTRVGPDIQGYPGMSQQEILAIQSKQRKQYFEEHFTYTREARAALGAVRELDPRIAKIVDAPTWQIPQDEINAIRAALAKAEKDVMAGRSTSKRRKQLEGGD